LCYSCKKLSADHDRGTPWFMRLQIERITTLTVTLWSYQTS
jgi:hypothetical protein